MADVTKSLWSRWIEGCSDNTSDNAPHHAGDKRKSVSKDNEDCPKICPEPKKPMQREEFCGKIPPQPPKCCFIRMQDPCAPCCCTKRAPVPCLPKCQPAPKRDPICGCDLCKRNKCADGKCCGSKEPGCNKAPDNYAPKLTRPVTELPAETSKSHGTRADSKTPCERGDLCCCRKNDISIIELIRKPLDWLLCTPLKIPILRIEWCDANNLGKTTECCQRYEQKCCQRYCCCKPSREEPKRDPCSCFCHSKYLCPHFGAGKKSKFEKCCQNRSPPDFTRNNETGYDCFAGQPTYDCRTCQVQHCFEEPAKSPSCYEEVKEKSNAHVQFCDCKPCRVRRVLEKPIY